MSDNEEDKQPEQQSAEDTSIWEDKITLSPDGEKHIRTDENASENS